MRARLATAIALAAIGCGGHKDGGAGAAAAEPPDVAALWAMAPADTDGGVVVSGRAMTLAEGAMLRLEGLGRASPEIAQAVDAFQQMIGPDVATRKLARWSDVGFAPSGLAFFHLAGDRTLAIVSIADRDKFIKAMHAKKEADGDHLGRVVCRTIAARYQCATDPKLFDAPRAEPAGHRAATLHGDVEVWVAKNALPASSALSWIDDLEIAAVITPGAIAVRAHVPINGPALDPFVVKPVVAPGAGKAAGLFAADLAPLLAKLPPAPGPIGDALHAIAGPITVTAPAGTLDLDARVALRDPAPVKALLAACDQLLPPGAGVTATPSSDGCHVRVAAGLAPFDFDLWVDGTTLRAARDRKAPPVATADVAPTALGVELGDGTWTAAIWGRGAVLHNVIGPGSPPGAGVYAAPFFALSELGFGVRVSHGLDVLFSVRTVWADPDDVVAALAPLIAKAVRGEEITDDVKGVAAKFPQSGYAADVRAGEGGLLLPIGFTGLAAAIAVPLLLDYQRATPGTEADLQLDNLAGSAKRYYYAHVDMFPVGTVPLTPATPCCAQPGAMCAPVPADWADPVWQALRFHMTDAPFRFQYSYTGDGKTFTATAVGDPACDGQPITYVMNGDLLNGDPRVTVTKR